jgi:hypothetical protein
MSDVDSADLFPDPVKAFGRPFRDKILHRLFTGPTISPSYIDHLTFDVRDREMADQFDYFVDNWSRLRRFPNFSVLYICVLVTLHVPDRHETLLRLLVEITSQTPGYSIPLLPVVLPVAFVYFSESAFFATLGEALFVRFSPDDLLPTFCRCLYQWPDTFAAYAFLCSRTRTFEAFSADSVQLLSSTLSLLQPKDARIAPLIAAIIEQLALVRETAPPRARLSLSPSRGIKPSASIMVSTQLLYGYLDQIESGVIEDDAPSIVQHMASHFRKHPFPDRRFRPVMEFALRVWAAHDQQDEVLIVADCREVLKAIDAVTARATEIYALYDEFSLNPELNAVAELAYAQFRRGFANGILPDGTQLPYSLERATDVDKRGQLAIQEMRKLTTAYDGVTHLWELLTSAPNYDVITPFRKFNMAQKCVLVEGFRLKARNDRAEGREQRLQLIEELEALLRTPSPRAEREASESSARMTKLKLAEDQRLLTPPRRIPRPVESRTLTPKLIRRAVTAMDDW